MKIPTLLLTLAVSVLCRGADEPSLTLKQNPSLSMDAWEVIRDSSGHLHIQKGVATKITIGDPKFARETTLTHSSVLKLIESLKLTIALSLACERFNERLYGHLKDAWWTEINAASKADTQKRIVKLTAQIAELEKLAAALAEESKAK